METNLLFSAEAVALDLGNTGLCTRLSVCLERSSSFTAYWPNLATCSQGFLDLRCPALVAEGHLASLTVES